MIGNIYRYVCIHESVYTNYQVSFFVINSYRFICILRDTIILCHILSEKHVSLLYIKIGQFIYCLGNCSKFEVKVYILTVYILLNILSLNKVLRNLPSVKCLIVLLNIYWELGKYQKNLINYTNYN